MNEAEKIAKFNAMLDAFNVPPQIEVQYSKLKLAGLLAFGVLVTPFVIYSALENSQDILTILFCIVTGVGGLFSIYTSLKSIFDEKPVLMMSPDGIYTRETNFLEWKDIYNEHIEESIKNDNRYLRYNYPDGNVKLLISGYNLDAGELKFFLEKYRQLYNIKKNIFHL